MKPILFNTDMVKAILDGRKTVTRRVAKNIDSYLTCDCNAPFYTDKDNGVLYCTRCGYPLMAEGPEFLEPLYHPDDILYVRETFSTYPQNGEDFYIYKTHDRNKKILEDVNGLIINWRPSIHMPKEAARIFLRVTDVRVERLQDMTEGDVIAEGAEALVVCRNEHMIPDANGGELCWNYKPCENCPVFRTLPESFGERVWNPTIKKSDRDKYGWAANPYVYVVEFKVISKEEAMQ